MATAQKRNVPARTARPPVKAKEPDMFEALTEVDADGNMDVKIFGEPFTISTDVNGWLLMLAGSGQARDVVRLVQSILVVVPADGQTIDAARLAEERRFNDLLGGRKNFTIENTYELINALTEVSAGNDQ